MILFLLLYEYKENLSSVGSSVWRQKTLDPLHDHVL